MDDGSVQGSTPASAPGSSPTASSPASSGSSGAAARNLTRGTVLASRLESADGLWAKFMGLMGRADLPAGAGLWLPESNGIHMMFMRFAIDAVFVGKPDAAGARAVLSVHPALPAWRGLVPLVRGAHGVLELPVGTIAATDTAVGDQVVIG
jgi:uncharacterized membrane protein (UPF0127 family)